MDLPKDSTDLIVKDFELETTRETLSEDELLDLLAERIAYLLENRIEFLFSLMYRLDIAESKVNFALSPFSPDPPAYGVAKLVLDRQKQRNLTKQQYRSKPPGADSADWKW